MKIVPLSLPIPSIIKSNFFRRKTFNLDIATGSRKSFGTTKVIPLLACKSCSDSAITEFNLYDLLGVDSSSNQAEIKMAYRTLQKRCHPDIAGPAGHDMAIILNEAYALLSDPSWRLAYDKEQAKTADLQGYTGKPMYSVWLGSEHEQRAVFVDEVKCVGCLKCALFAEKTFAVESAYGRARVVAQWADPEHKIQEAIDACPVDCISYVERSNLAALEFLMSKQPRGKVRIGAGNTVGARTSDIFNDLEKFLARYAQHKASKNYSSKESEAHITARESAIRAVQMISNWVYWHAPGAVASTPSGNRNLIALIPQKSSDPNVKKLQDAAEARKEARETGQPRTPNTIHDEYWSPTSLVLPQVDDSPKTHSKSTLGKDKEKLFTAAEFRSPKEDPESPLRWWVPVGTAVTAAVFVRLNIGEQAGGIEEHVGGSLLLGIVNSSWLQVILAGVTWYLIGMYVVELVEAFKNRLYRK